MTKQKNSFKGTTDATEVKRKVTAYIRELDYMFSGEEWEMGFMHSMSVIALPKYSHIFDSDLGVSDLIRVGSLVGPDMYSVQLLEVVEGAVRCQITAEVIDNPRGQALLSSMKNFLPYILLVEFDVSVRAKEGFVSSSKVNLKDLKNQGKLVYKDSRTVWFEYPLDFGNFGGQEVLVIVNMADVAIRGNPLKISTAPGAEQPRNMWTHVDPNVQTNITRTGKPTDDLDASDLRSLGILNNTSIAASKPLNNLSVVMEEESSGTTSSSSSSQKGDRFFGFSVFLSYFREKGARSLDKNNPGFFLLR